MVASKQVRLAVLAPDQGGVHPVQAGGQAQGRQGLGAPLWGLGETGSLTYETVPITDPELSRGKENNIAVMRSLIHSINPLNCPATRVRAV